MTVRIINKALIYATWQGDLLVFDEPDFPDLLPQVPGGTIEAKETQLDAAMREFAEETGLTPPHEPAFLTRIDHRAAHLKEQVIHRRHFFHVALNGSFATEWLRTEHFPSTGEPPVLMRFFWIPVKEALLHLGYEHQAALPLIL